MAWALEMVSNIGVYALQRLVLPEHLIWSLIFSRTKNKTTILDLSVFWDHLYCDQQYFRRSTLWSDYSGIALPGLSI